MKGNNERLLPVQGAYNVRDLGGYTTQDNKTVKWKKVLRSGDLNMLTERDLEYLSSIPVISFIDFRDSAEISVSPDRIPSSLVNHYYLPIETANIIDFRKITPESAPTLLIEANKSFVRNDQDIYRKFFEILMDEKNIPLLFHCSAGKDRTGYAAVLFLSSLGVDKETAIQDYLLSATYLEDKYVNEIKAYPVLAPLMTVKREYIEGAFDVIENEYGGMENYLINNLAVNLEKMKAIYTE